MRRMIRTLAVPTLSVGAMACATLASAKDSEEDVVAKGHDLLKANCSRCHAITMDDTSKHEEAPPFRVVVTRYPPEDLAESLAEGIVSGHPDMPEFVFQPAEIEAILAYLGSLRPGEENAPPSAPDVPEKKD